MLAVQKNQTQPNEFEYSLLEKHTQEISAQLSDQIEPMSWLDILKSDVSSAFDSISRSTIGDGIDFDDILKKHKTSKPNPRPYVSIDDLNNSDDAPYENKPKTAIEIGIKFDF